MRFGPEARVRAERLAEADIYLTPRASALQRLLYRCGLREYRSGYEVRHPVLSAEQYAITHWRGHRARVIGKDYDINT